MKMMKRYRVYLVAVLWHKWCVWEAGRALGVSVWSLFWHDWDKFLPRMMVAYARHFYNADGTKRARSGYVRYGATGDAAFDRAWLAHVRRNRHHHQYWSWVEGTDSHGQNARAEAMQMPMADVREMVADWRGASKAYGGDARVWYLEHRDEIVLHPATRYWVETQMGLAEAERRVRSSVWADPAGAVQYQVRR